jgi:membrane-associated phospholipid phosphatase
MRTREISIDGRRQVLVFLGAYVLYSMSRWVAVGDLGVATDHAHWVVDVEESTGVRVESQVQDALQDSPLLWLLNHLYLAAQLVVVPGTLVWAYRRAPRGYVALRATVLATWLLALPIYALFPVAPPRLAGIGMVDTISSQSGIALNSKLTTSFYNQLAAVPSLHAGFALAVSVAIAVAARRWWIKLAAALWAPTIALAVVATGNHFVFDIAAGCAITVLGYALGHHLRVRWRDLLPRATAGPLLRPVTE